MDSRYANSRPREVCSTTSSTCAALSLLRPCVTCPSQSPASPNLDTPPSAPFPVHFDSLHVMAHTRVPLPVHVWSARLVCGSLRVEAAHIQPSAPRMAIDRKEARGSERRQQIALQHVREVAKGQAIGGA